MAALGFHAQQSAEKALKAVTVRAGLAVPRTHDLAALGAVLSQHGLLAALLDWVAAKVETD